MNIVILGDGPQLAAWIAAARTHSSVRSIAVVSRGEGGVGIANDAVRSYATLRSAHEEARPSVALLTGTATLNGRDALDALEFGLDVVLDRPVLDLASVSKLAEVARSSKHLVILALQDTAGSTAKRLRSLVRNVGSISHVSYIDRRPRSELGAAGAPYAQLILFGLIQIDSLCSLFDSRAVKVMARYSEQMGSGIQGTTAEVLLELERNIHVQYFGSTGASHREQSLWVEGKGGSLRSEGANVWWRKRGWPRFLLWRWWPAARADDRRLFADTAQHTFDLLQKSANGGAAADEARRAMNDRLALLGSVLRSNQESRIVDVADWMRASG